MLTSALSDLRRESNWDPARLTAASFSWPTNEPMVPLRDIAALVVAQSFADSGAPVVLPQGIDQIRGGVRKRVTTYQGPVFQVGRELRSADVLIPRVGSWAALRVSDEQRGALFSGRFIAMRPTTSELSLWLWAVLSSETGRRYRESLSRGSVEPMLDSLTLLDAPVPLPSESSMQSLTERLRAEERTTHHDEEEPVHTWWRTVDLREHGWHLSLATPEPERLDAGTPLGVWSADIRPGRNTRQFACEAEVPGYLPVADVSMLGGRPPRRWVPADESTPVVAEPGDLLVAALGNPAHATVVEAPLAVDTHVFRVRLLRPALGLRIAQYLNSQDGYQVRQILLTGSTVPHLSRDDLARLPIPEMAMLEESLEPISPLATRLERILWPR